VPGRAGRRAAAVGGPPRLVADFERTPAVADPAHQPAGQPPGQHLIDRLARQAEEVGDVGRAQRHRDQRAADAAPGQRQTPPVDEHREPRLCQQGRQRHQGVALAFQRLAHRVADHREQRRMLRAGAQQGAVLDAAHQRRLQRDRVQRVAAAEHRLEAEPVAAQMQPDDLQIAVILPADGLEAALGGQQQMLERLAGNVQHLAGVQLPRLHRHEPGECVEQHVDLLRARRPAAVQMRHVGTAKRGGEGDRRWDARGHRRLVRTDAAHSTKPSRQRDQPSVSVA